MSQDLLSEHWNDIKLAELNEDDTEKQILGLTTVLSSNETNSPNSNMTASRTKRKKIAYNPNGNVSVSSQIAASEAAKLLEISSDSTSESDLNLQLSAAPKRKVRFKRKFRPMSRAKPKGGSTDLVSCPSCRCSDSLGIFAFVSLAVCLAVLIWFHYNLRSRMDDMQKQYTTLEAQNKETPEALHDYHIQLKSLEFNVSSFSEELKKLISEISSISEEFKQLKLTTNNLEESIAAAPEMKSLPKTVLTVSQTAATLGSKMALLENTVAGLKQQQNELKEVSLNITKEQQGLKISINDVIEKSRQAEILKVNNREGITDMAFKDQMIAYVHKEILQVTESIDDLNTTMIPKLNSITTVNDNLKEINETVNWAMDDLRALHTYVYTNLSLPKKSYDSTELILEQTIQKMVSDGINSKNVKKGTWQEILQEASQMSLLYLDISQKVLSIDETQKSVNLSSSQHLADQLVNTLSRTCVQNVQLLSNNVASQAAELKSFQSSINQSLLEMVSRTDLVTFQLAQLKDINNNPSTISTLSPREDQIATENAPPSSTIASENSFNKESEPVPNNSKILEKL